ncbi:hypothetical protein GR157_11650 [Burkholderia sp. 4701]|nr:hypothetical protein [Burkholderia sp. 4701]MXN82425.1 hypothetical protein [Burkholderia sp. 4812]
MMESSGNRGGNAKALFDEANRRLEAAEARIRALFANPLADDAAKQAALEAYQEVRLLWLSAEAVLRSATIVENPPRQAGRRIVILRGSAHVGESIALLLRLRGFRTTVVPKSRADETMSHGPPEAIIFDVERDPDEACVLAVSVLDTYPDTRIVAMVPPALGSFAWRGFDIILVKPASIDMILHAIAGDTGA